MPAPGTVDVAVLGPLQIRVDGHLVEVSAGRLRAFVAVLALSAGRPVSADNLVAAVWGEKVPLDARRSVRTYVTRLRHILGPAAIRSLPQGYLLSCREVDALRFEQMLDAATASADRLTERTRLAQALALWRGTPFDGVRAVQLEQVEAPRLTELYVSAVERHIDLDLASGRDRDLVGRLRELTARYPLRERFWAQLMTALFHAGRQADALQAYRTLHRMLDDELGVAPGSAVRELHRRILLGDASPGAPTAIADPPLIPRQLPAAVAHVAGRTAELARLDEVAQEADERATVVMITGGAGVGKTTLAIDWARRAAAKYPDGQLYVDLRGFGPPALKVPPGDAVRTAIEALGVPPAHVPTSLDAQSALYRSLVAGKRVLVLLDNAADAEHVFPLLPGTPGCLTVVTGRRLLPGLLTRGAHPIVLDVLARDDARDLLAARLGAGPVSAASAAVDRIIEACAGLPLALAIVSARAAASPRFSLTALAADIDEFRSSLDALASADADTDIRSVFWWSYAALSPAAQRLFRLLSLDCGAVTSLAAAASLAGIAAADVRPLLGELCQAHLLTEHKPRRYGYHDLLRVYAAELLGHTDGEPGRVAALHRLLDYYVTTACQAARLIEPLRDPIKVVRHPREDTTGEPFADREQALTWFHEHLPTLLAAVSRSADTGLDAHAWQLAWALADLLQWQGRWNERVTTLTTALAATRRLGDRDEQARAHRGLGVALTKLGRYEQAGGHLRQALKLYQELGNTVGQVRTHQGLSHVSERLGDHRGALRHVEHALRLSEPRGSTAGLGRLLNSAGWCHAQLGNLTQARRQCEHALTLLRDAGDRVAEAATWDSLGYISFRLGETEHALHLYMTALELRKAIGHRYGEAITLDRLGDTYEARGDLDAARERWQEALVILEEMADPGADAVRAKVEPRSA